MKLMNDEGYLYQLRFKENIFNVLIFILYETKSE